MGIIYEIWQLYKNNYWQRMMRVGLVPDARDFLASESTMAVLNPIP